MTMILSKLGTALSGIVRKVLGVTSPSEIFLELAQVDMGSKKFEEMSKPAQDFWRAWRRELAQHPELFGDDDDE